MIGEVKVNEETKKFVFWFELDEAIRIDNSGSDTKLKILICLVSKKMRENERKNRDHLRAGFDE